MSYPYYPRLIRRSLNIELSAFPVVVLTGPRQVGKSTLAREGAHFVDRPYLTLDDASVRQQAVSAPDDLLKRYARMTLDEVQREPELLMAAKAIVDRDRPRQPGRFLLTGSANLLLMRAVGDSLAGRAAYRVLHPMTRREQLGHGRAGLWPELMDATVDNWPALLLDHSPHPADWRAEARKGGFPVPALELHSDETRSAWFEGYLRTYLERDLRDLTSVQSLPQFRRLMRAAALRLGGLVNQSEISRDIGIPLTSVQRHLGILEMSHLLTKVEAYSVNRTKRLIKAPKLYWADSGLAMHLAGAEPSGAHLENLILTDLLAWSGAQLAPRPHIYHWRTASGREVDFVIEREDQVVGIEVKSTTRPSPKDARHLRAFREEYGESCLGCLLLHAGDETFRMSEGIVATPWWRVL